MKKLFFDISLTGHHPEYISHLVNYINDNPDDNVYYFVVHPNFKKQFKNIFKVGNKCKNLNWVFVSELEIDKCLDGGLVKKSFKNYKLMSKYAKLYNVNQVFLLYFNIFQFALIFLRPKYSVSGILFLQFYRMSINGWKDRIKFYRKYFITRLYALNPRIKEIYILNDSKTVNFLNNKFKTSIFKMLPDPIPNLVPLEDFDIYKHYSINPKKKIFLHIGSLGERKGTFELIEALHLIPKSKLDKIAILLVGKPESENTRNIILEKIQHLNSDLIYWDNEFVTDEKMKAIFNQCHIVVMPYKNVEASSGILGHAVAANKKVITTGQGLLKEIVVENNLGVLINEVKPEEIAIKMFNLLEQRGKTNFESISYLKMHTPKLFSEKILIN